MKRLLARGRQKLNSFIALTTNQGRRHSMVGPAHLWKMKRDFQNRFLRQIGLRPEHYFLEIGCGTLRGGIPIIQYLEQGHYFGLDVRNEVIEEAKKEVTKFNLEAKNQY